MIDAVCTGLLNNFASTYPHKSQKGHRCNSANLDAWNQVSGFRLPAAHVAGVSQPVDQFVMCVELCTFWTAAYCLPADRVELILARNEYFRAPTPRRLPIPRHQILILDDTTP